MTDDYEMRVIRLEGRVDAHLKMITDIATTLEVSKLRGTIKEERSPSCRCSSSSPSVSPASLSSDERRDAVIAGVRNSFARNQDGMWLSREELLVLLGEPA